MTLTWSSLIPAGGVGVAARASGRRSSFSGSVTSTDPGARPCATSPGIRPFAAVVVAAPAAHVARTRRWSGAGAGRARPSTVVEGGVDAQESVWRALQAAPADAEIVLVHDAVRPFITRGARSTRCRARRGGAGRRLCALPIAETVKRVRRRARGRETLDRASLWAVQTPQGVPRRAAARGARQGAARRRRGYRRRHAGRAARPPGPRRGGPGREREDHHARRSAPRGRRRR